MYRYKHTCWLILCNNILSVCLLLDYTALHNTSHSLPLLGKNVENWQKFLNVFSMLGRCLFKRFTTNKNQLFANLKDFAHTHINCQSCCYCSVSCFEKGSSYYIIFKLPFIVGRWWYRYLYIFCAESCARE